jgi:three-Cys-motif partner protein
MVVCPTDGLPARIVKAHNIYKASSIQGYADLVAKSMKNKWENLAYIDLFCGPGICWVKDTGEFVYGSPLIAQDVEPAYSHFIFNDKDPVCVNALKTRLAQATGSASYMTEDVNAPATILSVRSKIPTWTLSLVLLDPQGCNLEFETIRRLVTGKPPLDLLINLPINSLKRSREHPHVIDRVLGTGWQGACNLDDWPRTVRAFFQGGLTKLGYQYSVGQQIFSEKNKSPLYDFLMASRNSLAERFFKEVTRRDTPYGQMAMPMG